MKPYIQGDCLIDVTPSSDEQASTSTTEDAGEDESIPIEDLFVPDMVNFQTPPDLCDYMVSLIPKKYRHSLTIEPTPGAGNLITALRRARFRNVESPPGDFFLWSPSGRPRVVVGNPPWTPSNLAYEIMNRCLGFSPNFVVLLLPWLTLINSQRRAQMLLTYGLKQVIHIPRSTFPGIRAQCCIYILEKGYNGAVELGFHGINRDALL